MKTLKLIGISLAIWSLLLIGTYSSDAAEITSFSVYGGSDYGGGSFFSASLSADADIQFVDWWIKQTWPADEADSEYEKLFTSSPYGGPNVYEYLGSFDGHIKIAEYSIKAVAWFSDAENNTFVSDTSTTTTSVYKPVYEGGYKQSGIHGYSELTAHYFDGSSIVMDGYAWAYNGTGRDVWGSGRFRHVATNKALDELEKDLPPARFKQGETYGYSTSDWGTYFNFDTGGAIQGTDKWVCNAYLRLVVGGDNWLATDTNTFNKNDNR